MWAGWGQRFLLVATKESLLCYFLPLAQTPFLFPWHSQSLPQWCHHRTNSRQLQPTSRSMKMPSPSSWPLACSKSCLGPAEQGLPSRAHPMDFGFWQWDQLWLWSPSLTHNEPPWPPAPGPEEPPALTVLWHKSAFTLRYSDQRGFTFKFFIHLLFGD